MYANYIKHILINSKFVQYNLNANEILLMQIQILDTQLYKKKNIIRYREKDTK